MHGVEPHVWKTVTHFTEQETEAQRGRRAESGRDTGWERSPLHFLPPASPGHSSKGCGPACPAPGSAGAPWPGLVLECLWFTGSDLRVHTAMDSHGLRITVPGQEQLSWDVLQGRVAAADSRPVPSPRWSWLREVGSGFHPFFFRFSQLHCDVIHVPHSLLVLTFRSVGFGIFSTVQSISIL